MAGVAVVMLGLAVGPWFNEISTPPVSHQAGEAHWSDWIQSASRDRCAPRKSGMIEGTDNDNYNCTGHSVWVLNESTQPIQCHVTLELDVADFEGNKRAESDMIVFPGDKQWGPGSMAPAAASPRFFSTCRFIPADLPPAPSVPAGCQSQVRAPDLYFYYPKEAIRRKEEGTVVIEYTTMEGGWVSDITVLGSSGFEALDESALRYGRLLRERSGCTGQRYRYEVHFVLTDEQRLRVREPRWVE